MSEQEVIDAAKKAGLIFNEEMLEGDKPAYQWHIDRLVKFAEECYERGYNEGYTAG